MKRNAVRLGNRGYYGHKKSDAIEYNLNIDKVNKLIDEYNAKINLFHKYNEQIDYIREINKKIKDILNEN